MQKGIALLGSTGSIGTQTLEVVSQFTKQLKVVGLAAGENLKLLNKQIQLYKPQVISIKDKNNALLIRRKNSLKIYSGDEGNCLIAAHPQVDIVVIATPGLWGINPTLAAIKNKKIVALATKEVLVSAGQIVMQEAKEKQTPIVPIDSEHSAIFQCLEGRDVSEVKRVILTASGGPFRGMKQTQLKNITVKQALSHPNWKMGKKISIDSATLMNKGFEVIEALWLFGIPLEKIEVVIHPQSVIHSAVEYVDGSVIAQIGPSDMRLPIQYALLYPDKRRNNTFKRFSFRDYPSLTFEEPDKKTFRCLELAFLAAKHGGSLPSVLTAANDIAVEAFLAERIPFHKIPYIIEKVLEKHTSYAKPTLEQIFAVDTWARNQASIIVNGISTV